MLFGGLWVLSDLFLICACAWQWHIDTSSLGLLWLAAITVFGREMERGLRELDEARSDAD